MKLSYALKCLVFSQFIALECFNRDLHLTRLYAVTAHYLPGLYSLLPLPLQESKKNK